VHRVRGLLRGAASSLLLFTALFSCGTAQAPRGPNGLPNRLEVSFDGVLESYERLSIAVVATGTDAVTLQMIGHSDPSPWMNDDAYDLHFELTLQRSAFEGLSTPAEVPVQGSLQFDAAAEPDGQLTWSPAPDGAVDFAILGLNCACAQSGAGTQRYEGIVEFERTGPDSVVGTIEVRMVGQVPNAFGDFDAQIVARFDQLLPGAPPG